VDAIVVGDGDVSWLPRYGGTLTVLRVKEQFDLCSLQTQMLAPVVLLIRPQDVYNAPRDYIDSMVYSLLYARAAAIVQLR
jgi:hypothetical protein